MEKAMAPHFSTLAWKIPWVGELGRLQSMGSWRVGHDWVTWLSLFTFMHWRRKWQPTPVFLPGESQGQGVWWATVSGVAQSRTQLKRLSSNSSRFGWSFVLTLSCVQLFVTLWTVAHEAPLSMGYLRQEYWSGLPFPSPGNFPDPGMESMSPDWQADS